MSCVELNLKQVLTICSDEDDMFSYNLTRYELDMIENIDEDKIRLFYRIITKRFLNNYKELFDSLDALTPEQLDTIWLKKNVFSVAKVIDRVVFSIINPHNVILYRNIKNGITTYKCCLSHEILAFGEHFVDSEMW